MKKIIFPIIVAGAVILGILIGNLLASRTLFNDVVMESNFHPTGKVEMLMGLIDNQYVDTVDLHKLEETTISQMLSSLDPHSSYIPAEDLQIVNDDLEDSFSGIGVQFNIQRDTIMVVQVIRGGPSEKVGLHPGDRIVEVDDSSFVGKEITSDKVVRKLRGPKGTKVKVGVKRLGTEEILPFEIVRGDIPTNSVDAFHMLGKTGYVRVSKFGSATFVEFLNALYELKSQGAESYIIDLRENSGGYLDAAIQMIDIFLEKGDMIVYTEGKAQKHWEAKADGAGDLKKEPIAVLIDEWSASASEIFAGAIQDNDRGIIVGRRSFGKGLVQQQIPLNDGSAIRMTIARYYTPAGRCIQKPYADKEEYRREVLTRYEKGEMDSDTVKVNQDSVKYYTKKGRVVYGGGGITPDVFIPRDTIGATRYFTKLHNTSSLYEFAFRYTDQHREELNAFHTPKELAAFLEKEELAFKAMAYAEGKDVKRPEKVSADEIKRMNKDIKCYIVRNIFGDEGFYLIDNESDPMVIEALKQLRK